MVPRHHLNFERCRACLGLLENRGSPMQSRMLEEDGHLLMVVRDKNYTKELCGFLRSDEKVAVETAYEMEGDLLSSRGYPAGSYAIPRTLPYVDVEETLSVLEAEARGDAQR